MGEIAVPAQDGLETEGGPDFLVHRANAIEGVAHAHGVQLLSFPQKERGAVGGVQQGDLHTGAPQALGHGAEAVKLQVRLRHIQLVRPGEMGKHTGDVQMLHGGDLPNLGQGALVRGEADAAHAGVQLDVDGVNDTGLGGQCVQLFRRLHVKNGGGELPLQQAGQILVPGIT